MLALLLPRVQIEVYKKLRVGYFSTGNELSPGQELDDGCIDSNRYTISAMLASCLLILSTSVLPDEPRILNLIFKNAAKVDLIITSGGVSVESDFTKQVMKSLGSIEFWKIAMRPRPMAVGTIKNLTKQI